MLGRRERLGHRFGDAGAAHHVRLDRPAVADDVARLGDATRPGVRGGGTVGVDHRDLPRLASVVFGEQRRERGRRRLTGGHELQAARSVGDLRHRLRGDGADSGPRPRHDRADEK